MLLPITTDEAMLPGYVKFVNENGDEVVFSIETGREVINVENN